MSTINSDYDLHGLGYGGIGYNDPFTPHKKTDNEMRIDALTKEYQKLKNQYSDLLIKATRLLEEYNKLEAENNTLKAKKVKRDSVIKTVENSKNFFRNIWNNFIKWLNT